VKSLRVFWSASRANRVSLTFLLALLLGVSIEAFNSPSKSGVLLRGDFPAFYTAAVLAKASVARELYSAERQRELQNQVYPDLEGHFLYFAYPPYVAQLLAPLAHFDYQQAKLVYGVLQLLLFLVIVLRIKREKGIALVHLLALFLGFAPFLVGFGSGQFSVILCFLYLGLLASKSPLGRGISCGLLFLKPHFGLFFLCALLVAREFQAALIAMVVSSLLYLGAAIQFGFAWPIEWFHVVKEFSMIEGQVNVHQYVSISGVTEALSGSGLAGIVVAGVIFIVLLMQANRLTRADILLFSGPACLLTIPHVLFYDLSLLLVSFTFTGLTLSQREKDGIILLYAITAGLVIVKSELVVQPLALLPALALLLLARHRRKYHGVHQA